MLRKTRGKPIEGGWARMGGGVWGEKGHGEGSEVLTQSLRDVNSCARTSVSCAAGRVVSHLRQHRNVYAVLTTGPVQEHDSKVCISSGESES